MTHTAEDTESPLLHLDRPRTLTLNFSGHNYTWSFRRIFRKDWETFFGAMATEATYIGGDAVETFELATAMAVLSKTTVEKVEGYRGIEEAGNGWKEMLPPRHFYAFGLALRDVSPTRAVDPEAIELSELHTVKIDCTWSNAEGSTDAVRFTGLQHIFTPPTMDQMRAYNRKCNTTRIKGNGRNGTTIYPVRQLAMMELYDELVFEVDTAYRLGGEPLARGRRDVISAAMDGCHKVAAIQAFLTGSAMDGAAIND